MRTLSLALVLTTVGPLAAQSSQMPHSPYNDGVAHLAPQDAMDHTSKPPIPPSKSLTVTFQGHNTNLSMADLLALPQTTVHVHNAHRNADETYTGPLLSVVLDHVGLHPNKEFEPLILHSAVIATGTDRYFALFSAAEAEPTFSKGDIIVAVMKSGLPDTEGGLIQLINTEGTRPARWVHSLANVNVITLQPQQ